MLFCTCKEMNKMDPMNEAWKLLKANPMTQTNLQGTNQKRTGGTIPQQLVERPGATYSRGAFRGEASPAATTMRGGGYNPERQRRPSVGAERSFQTLGHTGQEESAISRPPKQRFMGRRRDEKQQRLAQQAEETGAGADHRRAFPMPNNPQSVFEVSPSTMQRVQRM